MTSDTAAQQLELKLERAEQDKALLEQQLSEMSQTRGGVAQDLPQLQELQDRFDKYRELASSQADEAK